MIYKHASAEALRKNGKYYGYPDCCIQSFIDPISKNGRLPNATERTKAQQHTAKYGFIPCEVHAQQIQDKKITIEQLILPTRLHPKPFRKASTKD